MSAVPGLIAEAREAHERGVKSPWAWGVFGDVIDALEAASANSAALGAVGCQWFEGSGIAHTCGEAPPRRASARMLGVYEELARFDAERSGGA